MALLNREYLQRPVGKRRTGDDLQLTVDEADARDVHDLHLYVAQCRPVGVQAGRQHVAEPAVYPSPTLPSISFCRSWARKRRRRESNPLKAALQAAAVPSGSSAKSIKRPRQELNLVFDLRRVACDPLHHRDKSFNKSRRLDLHQHRPVYKTGAVRHSAAPDDTSFMPYFTVFFAVSSRLPLFFRRLIDTR